MLPCRGEEEAMIDRALRLKIPQPPPNVGRLLDAEEVAREIFNSKVSPAWVKANLKAGRTKLGHRTVVWAEYPVRAWLEEQVGEA